jgi:WD40 repeat protein
MEFSRDGRHLLAVTSDPAVWIWTLATPGAPRVLRRDAMLYAGADRAGASFSPDGSLVLTWPFVEGGRITERDADNPAARIWATATGRLRRELSHKYLQHAAFSPDGARVVTTGFNEPTVVVWDASTGTRLFDLPEHGYSEVVHAEFSRDGAWLMTVGEDDTVRVRAAGDGRIVGTLNVPGKSFMTGATFSPDSRHVLTISRDDPARLWDWQGAPGSPVAEITGHTGTVDYAEFSPDSTRLVTLAQDQTARVWDVGTGRNVQSLPHEEFIGGASFSPDSRWIATASADGLATLWETATGSRFMDFGPHEHVRLSVAFSPDGVRVATGTNQGEVLVHSCEVCGSTDQLLARAATRVTRALTADERRRYVKTPAP